MKEWHHIIPKFLGGSNSEYNLEQVTTEEHLKRHVDWANYLDTFEAWSAINCIISRGKFIHYKEKYELKIKRALSGSNSHMYGKKRPDLSEYNKTRINPNKGKKLSDETRKKQSIARKKYWEDKKNGQH